MADCSKCGTKAGLGKNMCASCAAEEKRRADEYERELAEKERQRKIDEHQQAKELRERQARERAERLDSYLAERFQQIEALLTEGVTPYLYDTIRLNSQSYFTESPNPNAWSFRTATSPIGAEMDLAVLQAVGLRGWEVVGVVPITFGSTLYNEVGGNTVYAAAYGGLVVGAEVLIRCPLTRRALTEQRDEIAEIIIREFPG